MTRAIRWLQAYAALMTLALVVLFLRSGTEKDGVLRARVLVYRGRRWTRTDSFRKSPALGRAEGLARSPFREHN